MMILYTFSRSFLIKTDDVNKIFNYVFKWRGLLKYDLNMFEEASNFLGHSGLILLIITSKFCVHVSHATT